MYSEKIVWHCLFFSMKWKRIKKTCHWVRYLKFSISFVESHVILNFLSEKLIIEFILLFYYLLIIFWVNYLETISTLRKYIQVFNMAAVIKTYDVITPTKDTLSNKAEYVATWQDRKTNKNFERNCNIFVNLDANTES